MGNAESLDAACCSKRELGHDDQDLMTRSDHHRRQQTTSSQKPGPTTCGIGLGLNAKLLSSRTVCSPTIHSVAEQPGQVVKSLGAVSFEFSFPDRRSEQALIVCFAGCGS
eukprot:1633537-Rhodomonas_salina.1